MLFVLALLQLLLRRRPTLATVAKHQRRVRVAYRPRYGSLDSTSITLRHGIAWVRIIDGHDGYRAAERSVHAVTTSDLGDLLLSILSGRINPACNCRSPERPQRSGFGI
jgi:hypothetical protein